MVKSNQCAYWGARKGSGGCTAHNHHQSAAQGLLSVLLAALLAVTGAACGYDIHITGYIPGPGPK
jgi:hypothetical protein